MGLLLNRKASKQDLVFPYRSSVCTLSWLFLYKLCNMGRLVGSHAGGVLFLLCAATVFVASFRTHIFFDNCDTPTISQNEVLQDAFSTLKTDSGSQAVRMCHCTLNDFSQLSHVRIHLINFGF
jgi:hypothetical protein